MRLGSDISPTNPLANPQMNETQGSTESRYADYKTIRRNGSIAPFQPEKITIALTKAFLAVEGSSGARRHGLSPRQVQAKGDEAHEVFACDGHARLLELRQ